MLHDILDDDHIQWHPPLIRHYTNFWPLLIWTLLPNLTYYLIVRGFHRTYATGGACQQRTLTPPDTWSCPTLGLASVQMLRPISWNCVVSRLLSFEHPSVLLFCFAVPIGATFTKLAPTVHLDMIYWYHAVVCVLDLHFTLEWPW